MNNKYSRTVRLSDTDAAGVVYFSRLLSICHEAYEESLLLAGINLQSFFRDSTAAIPVVRADINFFRPIFAGDILLIELIPQLLSDDRFLISYSIFNNSSDRNAPLSDRECAAKANTKHVCINPVSRTRIQLPETIIKWISS